MKIKVFLLIVILCTLLAGCAQEQTEETGDPTLLGADEIYPAVMVEDHIYEWRRGSAIMDQLPSDAERYGDVAHVEGSSPTANGEFVSVFTASGEIYTLPDEQDSVYLCLTTDWMEDTFVVFDLQEKSDALTDVSTPSSADFSSGDYPAAIMVDGTVFYYTNTDFSLEQIEENSIIGYTESYTDHMPSKNGETNFLRETGAPYATYDGGIVVLMQNDKWGYFVADSLAAQGTD